MVSRTDSLTDVEVEALIEQGSAEVDEEFVDGRIIEGKDGGDYVAREIVRRDADQKVLWDRRTGVPSFYKEYDGNDTTRKMLEKKDEDPNSRYFGKRIFTASSPSVRPENFFAITDPPTVYCRFHPEHPDYEVVRAIIGSVQHCKRPGALASIDSAIGHEQAAHPNWVKIVDRYEERTRRDEDRALAQANVEALQALATTAVKQPAPKPESVKCEVEDCGWEGPKLAEHTRKEHK